jgi:hypothetical protein
MQPTSSTWTLRTLVVLALACAALLAGGQRPADAQAAEVRLAGDNANNFFIVRAVSTTELEFCTDLLGCFRRPAADVQRIAIDGFDGDDGVFISHGTGFVRHPTVPISLTFDGGVGSDELRLCTIDSGCSGGAMTTDVSVLPEVDEIRVVQCQVVHTAGRRCVDEPFQQPVPTLKVNARGVDVVTDLSRGPLNVVGTPGDDVVTLDGGETFRNTATGANEVTGRASVGNQATYQFLNKDTLTLDTGAGADAISLAGRQGLLPTTTAPCARDGADAAARVCVEAGAELGDRLEVAAGSGAEGISLTTRVSDLARLEGLQVPPTTDIAGIDHLDLAVQPSQGDRFTLFGSSVADVFRWDAATADVLTITGDLAVGTSVPAPIPSIALHGDGTGAIRATVDALGGVDRVAMAAGAAADRVALRPAGGAFGATVAHVAGGTPHSTVTTQAELLDLSTGDGADVLDATGGVAAEVTWAGGAGPDALAFAGSSTTTADLGAERVADVPDGTAPAGISTAEVETWALDAGGRNLLVRGTAGPDALRYAPTGAAAATLTRDGAPLRVDATGVGGTMTVDPGQGDDLVAVQATTGADEVALFRGSSSTLQVGTTLPLRAAAATESVQVDGGTGDDRVLVSGGGGTATVTVLGGGHTGGDRLSFAAAVAAAAVAFDAAPASGTLVADGPPIAFRDLEHVDVEGDGSGSFTVRGSDADDVLVQDGGTVTAGRGTTAAFTGYPVLALHGLAGDDDVVVAPRTLAGVTDLQVAGGDAGHDVLALQGSALRETIAYAPDGPGSGRVEVSLAPAVAFAGLEAVEVDGRTAPPSGDTLLVRSPAAAGTVVVTPGTAVDQGSVTLTDATGPVTAVAPLHFGGLGRGSVVVDGADAAGAPVDAVRVLGQPDADVVAVTAAGGGSTTLVDTRVPVVSTSVRALQLHGLDGQDTFRLPAAPGLPGTGPAVAVDAGGPSGGDVAVLTGSGADVVVDLAARTAAEVGQRPVAFAGLDRLELDAAGAGATALGGPGPDAVAVRPTAPDAATVTADVLATRVDVVRAASLRVDGRAGADALSVLGSSAPDAVVVTRGDLPVVAVGTALPVTATDAVEALAVDAREGADRITLAGAGGPASLAVDGGAPASDGDVVRLESPDAEVTFADPATGGLLAGPGGAASFSGADGVEVAGDGSGALTVRGTDGPDTVTIGDPGTPAVRVGGGAPVRYTGYPSLVVDGRGGGDGLTVSYANLGDLATLTAAGGSALDDVVRVVDVLGATRSWVVAPSDADRAVLTADGGVPAVVATGAAQLQLVGRGGGDAVRVVTPDGAQDVAVTPGSAGDAATLRVGALLPVATSDLGADGRLAVGRPGDPALDHVLVDATEGADAIRVAGPDRLVHRTGALPLTVDGASAVTVRGLGGADAVTATGPLPWATTSVDAGGPDVGDRVALDGPLADAVVDLAAGTATGFGGTVRLAEVEVLETRHAARGLRTLGTDRDDALCYDPLTPRDGRLQVTTSSDGGLTAGTCQPAAGTVALLHTFLDVGRLVVDPGAGVDQVIVNGTAAADAVVVESTGPQVGVAVNPAPASTTGVRLAVSVTTATTEHLAIAGGDGVDDVDVRVHEGPAPRLAVHAELPDTRKGDHLTVRDMSGGANVGNTGSAVPGSGTVVVDWRRYSGAAVSLDYTGTEEVRLFKLQRPR